MPRICGPWAASSSTCWPVRSAAISLDTACQAMTRALCAGDPPFRDRSEYLTMERVSAADFAFSQDDHPPQAQSLVSQLLKLKPSERLGAACQGQHYPPALRLIDPCRATGAGEGAAGFPALQAHPFFEGAC